MLSAYSWDPVVVLLPGIFCLLALDYALKSEKGLSAGRFSFL
jgi:hypothetical protein